MGLGVLLRVGEERRRLVGVEDGDRLAGAVVPLRDRRVEAVARANLRGDVAAADVRERIGPPGNGGSVVLTSWP